MSSMYREVTRGIQVEVEPEYLPDHSAPEKMQYVFAYRIRITNLSQENSQLLSRRWLITDGSGVTREVVGPGVVGETPMLAPGQTYEYSSFCPLATPTGNMRGTYEMTTDSGERFEVKIPLFFLRDFRNLN